MNILQSTPFGYIWLSSTRLAHAGARCSRNLRPSPFNDLTVEALQPGRRGAEEALVLLIPAALDRGPAAQAPQAS